MFPSMLNWPDSMLRPEQWKRTVAEKPRVARHYSENVLPACYSETTLT